MIIIQVASVLALWRRFQSKTLIPILPWPASTHGSLEKSQWRVDNSVLLLKESIAIETLQYQYTGRTQNKKSERHVFPFGIRPLSATSLLRRGDYIIIVHPSVLPPLPSVPWCQCTTIEAVDTYTTKITNNIFALISAYCYCDEQCLLNKDCCVDYINYCSSGMPFRVFQKKPKHMPKRCYQHRVATVVEKSWNFWNFEIFWKCCGILSKIGKGNGKVRP